MKKMCSLIMSILLIAMFSIPAGAIETNLTQEEAREAQIQRYAYMDMEKASSADREKILKAREEIIYHSGGWYSREDGVLAACVTDKNGNVIEEVPEFHDLFPEDWEVPCSEDWKVSPSNATTNLIETIAALPTGTTMHYDGQVYLNKPTSAYTPPFCTFATVRGKGNPEVHGQAERLYNSANYNIGFTNTDNGKNISYQENLPAGIGYSIWVNPYVIYRIGVRASTNSTPGNSSMFVYSSYPN